MGTYLFAQRPQRLLVIDARPPEKVFAQSAVGTRIRRILRRLRRVCAT
jgi:hypothetical protein